MTNQFDRHTKKPYATPTLQEYGNIRLLTHAKGANGMQDGVTVSKKKLKTNA